MKSLPDLVVRAEAYKDDVAVPVTLYLNLPETDRGSIECGLLFDNDTDFGYVQKQEDSDYVPFFSVRSVGTYDGLYSVWIPRLDVISASLSTVKGDAKYLFHALGDVSDFVPDWTTLELYALIHNNPWTRFKSGPIAAWSSHLGQVELTVDYKYGGTVIELPEERRDKHIMFHIFNCHSLEGTLTEDLVKLADH
ncbi:MAG TPA: hypothetical protein PKX07_22230, partial [Aggregatilineales bacterium]|nr:hypothetical protein [Aggregatilineales bacterium]